MKTYTTTSFFDSDNVDIMCDAIEKDGVPTGRVALYIGPSTIFMSEEKAAEIASAIAMMQYRLRNPPAAETEIDIPVPAEMPF